MGIDSMVSASLNWASIVGLLVFVYGLAAAPLAFAQIFFTLQRRADTSPAIISKNINPLSSSIRKRHWPPISWRHNVFPGLETWPHTAVQPVHTRSGDNIWIRPEHCVWLPEVAQPNWQSKCRNPWRKATKRQDMKEVKLQISTATQARITNVHIWNIFRTPVWSLFPRKVWCLPRINNARMREENYFSAFNTNSTLYLVDHSIAEN